MKVLITGKNGQLASELRELTAGQTQHEFIFVGRDEMDLSNEISIVDCLNQNIPDLIVNCGAYTAVDKAETEEDLADKINHLAVKTIGCWSKKHNAKVIHISTDYVFDGNGQTPVNEDDMPNPINIYSKTKFKGEEALKNLNIDCIIIRTAWVYSVYGANFVKTMIRLMAEKEEISVVSDQIGSPTYAQDLAKVIIKIINEKEFKKGIYHYSNQGEISWYDFAIKIKELKKLNCNIVPISTQEYPTLAQRPKFSLLDKSKIIKNYGIEIPFWEKSLEQMINKL